MQQADGNEHQGKESDKQIDVQLKALLIHARNVLVRSRLNDDLVAEIDAALSEPSVAIQRIIDEVKLDEDKPLHGYNRTYHRHNR